jgi:hypothetical protein
MNAYRLYVLSPQERVADSREATFPDDNTALAHAEVLKQNNYAVEVWAGERLVARLGQEFRI